MGLKKRASVTKWLIFLLFTEMKIYPMDTDNRVAPPILFVY